MGRLAAIHGALIVVAGWSMVPRNDLSRTVGDLLPLVVAPLLYGEIPFLIAVVGGGGAPTYYDHAVQGWEAAVFHSQPSRTLARRIPVFWVSEVLHAGYLAYYAAIFIPPLVLFLHGERRGLGQTVLALVITYTVCWGIFVFFPVEGPRYLWGQPLNVPDGPVRRLTLSILAAGSSRGAAFPSSHMAATVVQMVLAFRWQRRMGWALAAIALLVGVGAVYGGVSTMA